MTNATRRTAAVTRWRERNPGKERERGRQLRAEFFDAYGHECIGTSDGAACMNSERRLDVLTIAHMGGDGGEHRRRIGGDGSLSLIRDLRRRGWPKDEGIATQCANCQLLDRVRK